MSISSFHQRPQYQLHDDNTHCGSSLQSLRNIFSWRNFNLEPDHFSSQSVPHRNRINHPRLRTTLLKPSYWLHHPETNIEGRIPSRSSILFVHFVLRSLLPYVLCVASCTMVPAMLLFALIFFPNARPPCAYSSSLLLSYFSLSFPLGSYCLYIFSCQVCIYSR